MKVPIENLYYLFCYAWRFIPDDLALDVGLDQCADVLNLCAHVLTTGIDRLPRRGLDRGYRGFTEETSRLRGRIDMTRTMTRLTWLNARAVCQFDELTPNILHNQILRTTVQILGTAPLEPDLRSRLLKTDRRLAGIDSVHLTRSLFRRVQLHRNNAFYGFLMRVCELVYSSLLPDRSGEDSSWFRDLLYDENFMAAVFEEFLRNFFDMRQTEFAVGRSHPKWNATARIADDLRFLPTMTTDITLSSTARLYQLMAYLRGMDTNRTPGQVIEGALIYPVGERKLDLGCTIDGRPIRIYTLNLGQPWKAIEADLLNFVKAP